MPFPQADIYASSLSHERVYDNNDEQRLSLGARLDRTWYPLS
jgi:hypothetical protein